MTQQWKPTGGRFDVEQLENINEVADLPDVTQLDEAQIYSIRSGEFAPDYVVPWDWDATAEEYQEWRSTVDGQVILDIPDSVLNPDPNDLDHFDGATGSWSITDDPSGYSPISGLGDYVLRGTSREDKIYSYSGLNRYPQPGEKFSLFIHPEDSEDHSFVYFGVQDDDTQNYAVQHINDFGLRIGKDRGDTVFEEERYTEPSDTWYEVEVEWDTDGDLIARSYSVDDSDGSRTEQLAEVSGNDTEYTDGGIGIEFISADPVGYQGWQITEILD